jgi:DNA replication protein DnaC
LEGDEKLHRIYREIENSKFVFIDEIGRAGCGGNKDIPTEVMYRIVKACYRKNYLVITTNMGKSELADFFDSYSLSRMHKNSGYCTAIEEFSELNLRSTGFRLKGKNHAGF